MNNPNFDYQYRKLEDRLHESQERIAELEAENERPHRPTAAEHALMDERLNLQAEVIELRRRERELRAVIREAIKRLAATGSGSARSLLIEALAKYKGEQE